MQQKLASNIRQPKEHITIYGKTFIAHPSGALIWPNEQALIVADPYLRSSAGINLEQQGADRYTAGAILSKIEKLILAYPIKTVIVIGQGFRRLDDPYHIDTTDITTLYNLQKRTEWIWVYGRTAVDLPHRVGGLRVVSYPKANLTFRAKPATVSVTHEIAAGTFPMAKVTVNARIEQHPCFVSNGKRLLMPAFGGNLAVHNILDDEFVPYFGYDRQNVQIINEYNTEPVTPDRLLAS